MSEISELSAESPTTISQRAKPVETFLIILAGSVLTSFLIGYWMSHIRKESTRKRLIEDVLQELTNWIREHSQEIADPIKGGLEATKSALERASDSGARLGRRLRPLYKEKKRSFLNLF